MDWFNDGLKYHVMYTYASLLRLYYIDDIFTMVFGDTPSGVYGIYVVLHVTYGRTYGNVA